MGIIVITSFVVFALGATIGSFLNVAILRYGTNMSVVNGRSRCMNCGKKLMWYELIPIFSFILQAGRCRKCHSKISWQYPLVEVSMAMLFLLSFNASSASELIFMGQIPGAQIFLNLAYLWFALSALMIIFVYDLKHKIIPDKIVWLFNLLALFSFFIIHNSSFIIHNFLSGLAFSAFFAVVWLISKGKWMGLGDAKLALGLGWFLGPVGSVFAFLFSFWLGAIVSITLMLLNKKKYTAKSIIPFAPFLILGSLLSYIASASLASYFVW